MRGDAARQKELKELWTRREDNSTFFLGGLGNSTAHNLSLGTIPRYSLTHPYYIRGQKAGDQLSAAFAAGESWLGNNMMRGGGMSLALSGGGSYIVSAPLFCAGGLLTGHGAAVMSTLAVEQVKRQFSAQGKSSGKQVQGVQYKKKKSNVGDKQGAKGPPDWAKAYYPKVGESGKEFAKRLLDEKCGPKNYETHPGSEFSKIKKWADRSFE